MERKISFNELGDIIVETQSVREEIASGVVLLTEVQGVEAQKHGWTYYGAGAEEARLGLYRFRRSGNGTSRAGDVVMSVVEDARRIREDAEHAGWKLGARNTRRVLDLLVRLAGRVDYLSDEARRAERERLSGYPGGD